MDLPFRDQPNVVPTSNTQIGSFVGKTGKLYIQVPHVVPTATEEYTQQTAIYPSVDSYNKRSARPDYQQLSTVIDDYDHTVTIDMQTLTIKED